MAALLAKIVMAAAAAFGLSAPLAQAETYRRNAGETPVAFAVRSLGLKADSKVNAVEAKWNGRAVILADYQRGSDDEGERVVTAFEPAADGSYRKLEVTVGEQEGGVPDVAAIGFANADGDAADEMIVILAWPQVHYDVGGTLYEVRILDDAKPGQTELTLLTAVTRHFDVHTCDCEWQDGRKEHFRFKTIAAVKAELKRMKF